MKIFSFLLLLIPFIPFSAQAQLEIDPDEVPVPVTPIPATPKIPHNQEVNQDKDATAASSIFSKNISKPIFKKLTDLSESVDTIYFKNKDIIKGQIDSISTQFIKYNHTKLADSANFFANEVYSLNFGKIEFPTAYITLFSGDTFPVQEFQYNSNQIECTLCGTNQKINLDFNTVQSIFPAPQHQQYYEITPPTTQPYIKHYLNFPTQFKIDFDFEFSKHIESFEILIDHHLQSTSDEDSITLSFFQNEVIINENIIPAPQINKSQKNHFSIIFDTEQQFIRIWINTIPLPLIKAPIRSNLDLFRFGVFTSKSGSFSRFSRNPFLINSVNENDIKTPSITLSPWTTADNRQKDAIILATLEVLSGKIIALNNHSIHIQTKNQTLEIPSERILQVLFMQKKFPVKLKNENNNMTVWFPGNFQFNGKFIKHHNQNLFFEHEFLGEITIPQQFIKKIDFHFSAPSPQK